MSLDRLEQLGVTHGETVNRVKDVEDGQRENREVIEEVKMQFDSQRGIYIFILINFFTKNNSAIFDERVSCHCLLADLYTSLTFKTLVFIKVRFEGNVK